MLVPLLQTNWQGRILEEVPDICASACSRSNSQGFQAKISDVGSDLGDEETARQFRSGFDVLLCKAWHLSASNRLGRQGPHGEWNLTEKEESPDGPDTTPSSPFLHHLTLAYCDSARKTDKGKPVQPREILKVLNALEGGVMDFPGRVAGVDRAAPGAKL